MKPASSKAENAIVKKTRKTGVVLALEIRKACPHPLKQIDTVRSMKFIKAIFSPPIVLKNICQFIASRIVFKKDVIEKINTRP